MEHEDKFRTGASSDAYRENFKKIFGDRVKAETGRFIMNNGEIIKADDQESTTKAPYVMSDMEEGQSPITGETITGRRAMRDHCRRHNVYYSGR